MAETEERSLDNFFAKRDKKKKKERSNRAASAAGSAGGAGGSSGTAGAAGGGAGAGARPGDGGTAGAGAAGPGAATKAVTKVRGRDSGPGLRACAHVPAPARLPACPPGGASGRGLRGLVSGRTGAEAGHVMWVSLPRSGRLAFSPRDPLYPAPDPPLCTPLGLSQDRGSSTLARKLVWV